jgi:hypothetical protein
MASNTKQIVMWSVVLICCILVGTYNLTRPAPKPEPLPINPTEPAKTYSSFEQRESFFNSSVNPKLKIADTANRKSAQRCLERVEASINSYRDGIKPFVADVNTWGTRLSVIQRLGSDWWYEENDVASYVGTKVSTHLFDDKRVKSDINSALQKFREEIRANEQSMLVKIRAAVEAHASLDIPEGKFDDFAELVNENMLAFAQTLVKGSILQGLITELVSGISGVAATELVYLIGSRIATMTAFSAATAGGTTVVMTGGGAAAGTTVGPWGTAAGLVGGFAVGLVIDWWRSKSYEAELKDQLNEAIDNIKIGAIQGLDGKDGLKITLDKACDQLLRTYDETLYKQIVGTETK